MRIPKIKNYAEKLLLICLAFIGVYLVGTAVYAHFSTELLLHVTVSQMLHSAFLAAVISLGGGLLLDCEIRHIEGTK